MMIRKTILSVTAAATLALAGTAAAPQPAHAVVWWVAPAIVAGAVGGVAIGAAAANTYAYPNPNASYAYEPQVYVQPTAGCHWMRVQTDNGLVRQRVCP